MLLTGLTIRFLIKTILYLCAFWAFAATPATLGLFGFFNLFKKRYLIAIFCYLGYFIFASLSLLIIFGIFSPPWNYQNPNSHEDFLRGVMTGMYVCAAFATINCVVFAFALKKKLFIRDSDS